MAHTYISCQMDISYFFEKFLSYLVLLFKKHFDRRRQQKFLKHRIDNTKTSVRNHGEKISKIRLNNYVSLFCFSTFFLFRDSTSTGLPIAWFIFVKSAKTKEKLIEVRQTEFGIQHSKHAKLHVACIDGELQRFGVLAVLISKKTCGLGGLLKLLCSKLEFLFKLQKKEVRFPNT